MTVVEEVLVEGELDDEIRDDQLCQKRK